MTDVLDLEYVVLRCADLERARRFYEAVGLRLTPEQHGAGARHYSAAVGRTVIELYPLRDRPTTGVRLGLRVASVDAAVQALGQLGAEIVGADATKRSVVVRDPDGHEIALSQPGEGEASS